VQARVNFVGTSGSVNGSSNVSSVSRTSTGQFTINFTSALAVATYSTVGTGFAYNNGQGLIVSVFSQATTNCKVVTGIGNSASYLDAVFSGGATNQISVACII
jgi:hypothetical protein